MYISIQKTILGQDPLFKVIRQTGEGRRETRRIYKKGSKRMEAVKKSFAISFLWPHQINHETLLSAGNCNIADDSEKED